MNSRNRFGAWRNAAAGCACAHAREPLQWRLQHRRRALRRDYDCCHLAFAQWTGRRVRGWKKLKTFATQTIAGELATDITAPAPEQALTNQSVLFTTSEYFRRDRVCRPCQHTELVTNKTCRSFDSNLILISIFRALQSSNNGNTFPKLIPRET